MEHYIPLDALVAEIERRKHLHFLNEGAFEEDIDILSFINTLEVKEVENMPNIRFPHYKSIVEKVFGSGNLESFEYNEAEQLVSLAKEELLKDLEVKEVEKDCNITGIKSKHAKGKLKECIDSITEESLIKARKQLKEESVSEELEKDVRQILSLYYEGIKHCEDIIKKERKENGGSDLAIKIMDGVVDTRELGIQYVLDKLKAQKGE